MKPVRSAPSSVDGCDTWTNRPTEGLPMSKDAEDVVKLASGSAAEVEVWAAALRGTGIDARVVGGDLTAGLGTAVPGAVELWVGRASAKKARAVLDGHGRSGEVGS